jgi:ribonucleoside-diphosphate reductase alpha chain
MVAVVASHASSEFDPAVLTAHLQGLLADDRGGALPGVDVGALVVEVAGGVFDGITTTELRDLVARTAAARSILHPGHGMLAGRIEMERLHRGVPATFAKAVERQRAHTSHGRPAPLVSDEFMAQYDKVAAEVEAHLVRRRDFTLDYFAVRTLAKSYLLRGADGEILETPQYMYMRVAIAVHGSAGGIRDVLQAYDDLSRRIYTHASPTLFNAGTQRPQMSSCFLLGVYDDSIDGIYGTLRQCAQISKSAGGIGLSVSNVRAKGSYIRGTQGVSNGLVPMLRVFNDTARYVDQGGGKRKGAIAVYIEPWHADIFDVLMLKHNQGAEELRARDLFYGLWIPDLFMERVRDNRTWTLFCPGRCPDLQRLTGDAFRERYELYESEGCGDRAVSARKLWAQILETQMETGGPYMLYKDTCNRKSNQRHLGTINCSNLCTEIVQYTSPTEVAVCNLGSLCLPAFVGAGQFDFDRLHEAATRLALSLNRVIDNNYYPVPQARSSNQRHRPVGIGVQGLADVFAELMLPYDSTEARSLNRDIFETIYHAALSASCALAMSHGPYETFPGSPASEGLLQPDLWGAGVSSRWDWDNLRLNIAKHGLRNSLLTAPMPTASTAQIAGNTESFEPAMSNLLVRRVLSGEFVVVNRRLVAALERAGRWPAVRDDLIRAGGSVQGLDVPDSIKSVFRTVWEMKQKPLLEMAADRGPFVDQSQSLNVFMEDATAAKLHSLHMYAWQRGLKTGMYYLHTRPAIEAVQFAVARGGEARGGEAEEEGVCASCSA